MDKLTALSRASADYHIDPVFEIDKPTFMLGYEIGYSEATQTIKQHLDKLLKDWQDKKIICLKQFTHDISEQAYLEDDQCFMAEAKYKTILEVFNILAK